MEFFKDETITLLGELPSFEVNTLIIKDIKENFRDPINGKDHLAV